MDRNHEKPGTSGGGASDGKVNDNQYELEQTVNTINEKTEEVRLNQVSAGTSTTDRSPLTTASVVERETSSRTDGDCETSSFQFQPYFWQPSSTSGSLAAHTEHEGRFSSGSVETIGPIRHSRKSRPRTMTSFVGLRPNHLTTTADGVDQTICQSPLGPPDRNAVHDINEHNLPLPASNMLKCSVCNYSCPSMSMLKSHLAMSHPNLYSYRCLDCEYATTQYLLLKFHLIKFRHNAGEILTPDGTRREFKFNRHCIMQFGKLYRLLGIPYSKRQSFCEMGNHTFSCRMEARSIKNRSRSLKPNDTPKNDDANVRPNQVPLSPLGPIPDDHISTGRINSDSETGTQKLLQLSELHVSPSSMMLQNNNIGLVQQARTKPKSPFQMQSDALAHNMLSVAHMQNLQSQQPDLTRKFREMNLERRTEGQSSNDDNQMETDGNNHKNMVDEAQNKQ